MARALVTARRGPLPFRGYPLRGLPPRGRPSCEPRRDPGKFQARASRPAAPSRSIRQQTIARSGRRGSGKKGGTHTERKCQSISGAGIDDAIGPLVFVALSPVSLDVSLAVQSEIQSVL